MGNRLADRFALVTGASSGIGRAIARRFAAEGAVVGLLDRRETPLEGGETTAAVIAAEGGVAHSFTGDVANAADIDAALGFIVERYGRLDVMVNNAAIFSGTDLLDTDEATWDRVMAVNLKGVFLGCQRAARQMLTQAPRDDVRGRIVNLSSQHGMVACPGDIAYGVSKAGCAYITRQIAADYSGRGIICNAVAPGKILTGRGGDAVSEQAIAYSTSRTPYPRLGRPADVASAALFLASDECTYVTGENLMVDGGWMAS